MRPRRFTIQLPVVLASLLPLLIGGPSYAADSNSIEGLWNLVDVILDDCPTGNPVRTVIDMKMFLHDGSMIETPGSPGVGQPPFKRGVPGLGSWQHVSGNHYTSSFRFFRYNGMDDTFVGSQTAFVDIELSKDGNALTTSTITNIFNANGDLIATRCTTGTGTRVE